MPEGLAVDDAGIVSGNPIWAGTKSFTLKVTDQFGGTLTKTFRIKVYKVLGILTKSLRSGKVGGNYRAALKSSGGKNPYSWSIISGNLPIGLSFNEISGRLEGMPVDAGEFNLKFRATDSLGGVTEKSLLLQINP